MMHILPFVPYLASLAAFAAWEFAIKPYWRRHHG